ncbi:cell division protein FtsA [Aerococcaceae bacterium DSM 111022]|nr:cell division protein FtsA [Aerococcaceae bacterium DSM 111022]
MRNQEIFVSLDIGTTSIKVVVAESNNGRVNIIGVGNEKSRGLSRGVIVDIDETVYSIQQAIQQAERKAGVKINEVAVGIPSNLLAIEECHGMVAVSSETREITAKDVDNVISAAKVRSVPPEREIISIIPEEFIVDGFAGIRDPRGMIGVRLELYARILTGPKTIIHNIRRCVERAGYKINELIVQPQALAEVVLDEDERNFGTVIIDMGGGQTSASIIYDDQLKYSFVDQEGGDFVTKDISIILNTSLDSAERIKREYGYAIASQTSEDEFFPVETVGKKEPVRVDEHYLAEIIEARLNQIFQVIYDDLERVEGLDLPGGFVITGGASSLPGTLELAQRYFGDQVRLYVPEEMGMRNPIYATSLGMIEYIAGLDDIHRIAQGTYPQLRKEQPRQGLTRQPRQASQGQAFGQGQQREDYGQRNQRPQFDNSRDYERQAPVQQQRAPQREEVNYEEAYHNYQGESQEDLYQEDYQDQQQEQYVENNQPAQNSEGFMGKIQQFFQTFFD